MKFKPLISFRTSCMLLTFLFIATKVNSQYLTIPPEYDRFIKIADSLSENKNYKEASINYRNAFNAFGWHGTPDDRYKAARVFALLGQRDSALVALSNVCTVNRYWNYGKMMNDPAFRFLKSSKKWNEIINCMKINKEKHAKNINIEWLNFLEDIHYKDQHNRLELTKVENAAYLDSTLFTELSRKMIKTDSINIIKITGFIDKYGWQGSDVVGNIGNMTLFLVIQHSNIDIQEKYLPVIKKAAEQKKATLQAVALLEDRISVHRNGYQMYGSQLSFNRETKKYTVAPIKDEADVNKRRKMMGLEPLEDYLKQFGIDYTPIK